MATMPTFGEGHIILASDWNTHANQINTHTGDLAALDSRMATSEGHISANDNDITALDTRVSALEDDTTVSTQADDTMLYGDVISNNPRRSSWYGEPLSNGYETAAATISTKTFTPSELRFCVLTPAEDANGTATFDVKFYVGPDVSSMSEIVFNYGADYITTAGVKTFPISGVGINRGDAVGIALVVTQADTPPKVAMTPSSANTAVLVSEGTAVYATYENGETYPLPTTLDMTAASWERADKQTWFAVS